MDNLIDYDIGDVIVSKSEPNFEIGTCTGFRHNEMCIEINGKVWGGKIYFMKSEFVEYEEINKKLIGL